MDRIAAMGEGPEKDALMEQLNDMQAQDMQQLFNTLATRCFNRCVTNFRGRELDQTEKRCVDTCAKKYMSHYQRIGVRFADENAQQSQAAAAAAGQQQ